MRSRESSITCNVVNIAKYINVYLCINDIHVENFEYFANVLCLPMNSLNIPFKSID